MGDIGGDDDLLDVALLLIGIVVKESKGSISSTKATAIGNRNVIFLIDDDVDR